MKRNISYFTVAICGAFLAQTAVAQTSPSAFTIAMRYDAGGRLTGTIAPDPDAGGPLRYAATRTTYDTAGRSTKVETGELLNWQPETVPPSAWESHTTFTIHSAAETTYDASGRQSKVLAKGSDGATVSLAQYSYDANGRLECVAQRMNPNVYGSLPASACSLGTQGIFGPDRITRNIYDAGGQLLKVQKAYATALQEDHATYTYSPNGKRTSLTDARGYKASMTYDTYDRQVKWNFPSPTTPGVVSTTDYEEYGYDANGNRTSLRKRDGSVITYQYDALNRNTVKIVPVRAGLAATHTRDVYYGYDLRGLQTYARFDSGAATSDGVMTAHDGFGRMTSSALKMDGVTRTLAYAHDKNGNRTELTWPDAAITTYAYDGLDRMTTLFQGPITLSTNMVDYAYNARGLRSSQTARFGPVTTFGYDPFGRLNALSHNVTGTAHDVALTYGYTPASQIAQQNRNNDIYAWTGHFNVDRNYTANGLNQYTAAGPAAFAYDANGNLTSDGSTTYVYDIENRLVSASGATNAALRYDPLGRLYETVGGGNTTRFLYDGDELVAEYNSTGTLLRRYAHGKNVDDPVLWYEGSSAAGGQRWLHSDHQGSVVAVTDGTGAAIAINAYDEYGIPKTGNLGRFQYTGQAWVSELGMYHYKARIYSPTLGRFLQTDPIGYDDQVNLYAYVGADPLNRSDPTGTQSDQLMDRRNQAILKAMSDCQGRGAACAAMVGDAVMVALISGLIVVDVLDGPQPDVGAAALAGRAALKSEARGASAAMGIVYRRVDPDGGKPYIGRSDSEALFQRRMRDHDRQLGKRHEYEILERAPPGQKLRQAEQRQIEAHGGPTNRANPDGGTQNKRNEMRGGVCSGGMSVETCH